MNMEDIAVCPGTFSAAAEWVVFFGRVVDVLDVALPTQTAYGCFIDPYCAPVTPDSPRVGPGRLWFERARRMAAVESCAEPSPPAVRVSVEASVYLGTCPTEAERRVVASLPPIGDVPARVVGKTPDIDEKLAADPVAAVLAQVRRDRWIGVNAPRVASESPPNRSELLFDLARAHLERVLLAEAMAHEVDPWSACGPRPASAPFVPLCGDAEVDAALDAATAYAAQVRGTSPAADRLWQLVLLERGECAELRATMAFDKPGPKSDWLAQQVEARWPGPPGSCPSG